MELDLFTRIAHGTDTPGKIAYELNIPVRGVRLICEYLAVAGLLEKEDEQLKVRPEIAAFLDKTSPKYLGEQLRILYSPALLRGFEQLTEAARNGAARNAPAGHPEWLDLARGLAEPSAATSAFVDALQLPDGPVKVLEIGGTNAGYGIAVGKRYRKSVVVSVDLPDALAVAQGKAEAAGLGTRFQNIPGDPLVVDLGTAYDVTILPGTLFQYNEAQITMLLMRLHDTLKKSGKLAVLELLAEDTPEFYRRYAGFRLNVLAATARADALSLTALKAMLEAAGYRGVEARPLAEAAATFVTANP